MYILLCTFCSEQFIEIYPEQNVHMIDWLFSFFFKIGKPIDHMYILFWINLYDLLVFFLVKSCKDHFSSCIIKCTNVCRRKNTVMCKGMQACNTDNWNVKGPGEAFSSCNSNPNPRIRTGTYSNYEFIQPLSFN